MTMLLALNGLALAVPLELEHTGRLFDSTGLPVSGAHPVQVALFDAQTGGTEVFAQTDTLSFDDGYFSVRLGANTANPLEADDLRVSSGTLWVELTLDSTPLPRQPLASVPYAVLAGGVAGGVVDASEIKIDGATVIDSSGAFLGTDTLAALGCTDGQIPLYSGSAWSCGSTGGAVEWDDVTNKPAGFVDDDDSDILAGLACSTGAIPRFEAGSGNWTCSSDATPDWSTLQNIPNDLVDGEVSWLEVTGVPVDLQDGTITWSEISGVSSVLLDGDVDWSELQGIPTHLSDGSIDWSEVQSVPLDLADGTISWAEVASKPAFLDNDAVDWPEVAGKPAFLDNNTVDWTEIAGRPSGLDDGDTVLTEAEVDAYANNNGYALAASLSSVATSGDYGDLSNVPEDTVQTDVSLVGDGSTASPLGVDYVKVAHPSAVGRMVEAEDMPSVTTGTTVSDATASGGQARLAAAADANGRLAGIHSSDIGNDKLGFGDSRVRFRLKVADNSSASDVVNINCSYNQGTWLGAGPHASYTLAANDFAASDTWQEFELPCAWHAEDDNQFFGVQFVGNGVTDVSFDMGRVDAVPTGQKGFWRFDQSANANIGTTRTVLPGLDGVSFDLDKPATVRITYHGQIHDNGVKGGQHCAVWMLVDGTLISNDGGYGSGFIMLESAAGEWWRKSMIQDTITLGPGRHTLRIEGNRNGGNSGDCHYSRAYGGGIVFVEAFPL